MIRFVLAALLLGLAFCASGCLHSETSASAVPPAYGRDPLTDTKIRLRAQALREQGDSPAEAMRKAESQFVTDDVRSQEHQAYLAEIARRKKQAEQDEMNKALSELKTK
jgi:hypothetical protein